jgi:hypothetical protein
MLPTQSLEYKLQIPASSPTLDFGIGILKDGAPIELAVSITADNEPTWLFERRLDRAAQWQDVRLDLSAWAGRNVQLSLLGDFVERLESLGLRENSLLVFVSDHGEHLGEHDRWEHRPPGYRQVTHVPLLLMHPSKLREAKRIRPTVQLMDVMPTVLELAQVDSSTLVFQGDSLVDLIEGRDLDYWENRISVSEEPMTMSAGKPCDCGSLFFDRWHLLSSTALRWEGVPTFLRWRIPQSLQLRVFDSLEDSEEMKWATWFLPDLVVKHRFHELMHDLQSTNIDAWRNWTAGDHEIQKLDPDTQEHLKALGYIQ